MPEVQFSTNLPERVKKKFATGRASPFRSPTRQVLVCVFIYLVESLFGRRMTQAIIYPLLVAIFVALVTAQHYPLPAPQSRICQFPSSGNIVWFIDATNYNRCAAFNNPKYSSDSNSTGSCEVSEKCVTIAASFFCSQYCGAVINTSLVLPACYDSCENYTQCATEFPCLPPIGSLGLPACSTKRSWEPDSSTSCTLLSVNLQRFSDGKDGYSQAGSGSRASESSFFFHAIAMVYRSVRTMDVFNLGM